MKLICWPVIEKDIIANLADFLWIFFKALHFRAGILCMIKGEVRNPNVFSHIEVSYLASKASLEGILEGMPPAFFRRFVWNQPVCWHHFLPSQCLKLGKKGRICSIIHILLLQPFFCHSIIMIYSEERYICLLKY